MATRAIPEFPPIQVPFVRSFGFIMPTFWQGFARVFDLAGGLSDFIRFSDVTGTDVPSDREAIGTDWEMVEAHIAQALVDVGAAPPARMLLSDGSVLELRPMEHASAE